MTTPLQEVSRLLTGIQSPGSFDSLKALAVLEIGGRELQINRREVGALGIAVSA